MVSTFAGPRGPVGAIRAGHVSEAEMSLVVGPHSWPCQACELRPGCSSAELLDTHLFLKQGFKKGVLLDDIDKALDKIIRGCMASIRSERANSNDRSAPGAYMSFIFDICATALYANGTQKSGVFVANSMRCNDDAIFPHTWMCPKCLSRNTSLVESYLPDATFKAGRFYPDVAKLAKPGGRAIGDIGIKIIKAILRSIFSVTAPNMVMRDGGGVRGEFDLTLSSGDLLAFVEVKAKPLVCFPLVVKLREGVAEHRWERIPAATMIDARIYVAAEDYEVPVGLPGESEEAATWPIYTLAEKLSDPLCFSVLSRAWRRHLTSYRTWVGEGRETRWTRFGCGNFMGEYEGRRVEYRVANTKELPGLDRTDDIKKGTAQLLKFARFKFDCRRESLMTILLGNMYAETHAEDYADPLSTLRVSSSGDEYLNSTWIFDALIGFTKDVINNERLAPIFDYELAIDRISSPEGS